MAMRPPLPPPPLSGGVPGVLQISRRGHEKRESAGVELSSAALKRQGGPARPKLETESIRSSDEITRLRLNLVV